MDSAILSFINSPASVLSLLLLLLISVFKGWILPISWVDKQLQAKDETIDLLTAQLEDLQKAAPLVVKIMEELNRQASQKKIERADSGDYHA